MDSYKRFPELTSDQQAQAIKKGEFIGYTINEIRHLLFRVGGNKIISIRDNELLADTFHK